MILLLLRHGLQVRGLIARSRPAESRIVAILDECRLTLRMRDAIATLRAVADVSLLRPTPILGEKIDLGL
jgi:hypothetical protein